MQPLLGPSWAEPCQVLNHTFILSGGLYAPNTAYDMILCLDVTKSNLMFFKEEPDSLKVPTNVLCTEQCLSISCPNKLIFDLSLKLMKIPCLLQTKTYIKQSLMFDSPYTFVTIII